MNIYSLKSRGAILFLSAVFCISCASAPEVSPPEPASLLPLAAGWYLYNFERTFKGIEDEYNFAQSTGMTMVEELTLRQNGTVVYYEDGILHDPVLDVYLSIDETGRIRCFENPSISGTLSGNGAFFWSGLTEEHGRMNHAAVTGFLIPLPPSSRGGSRYDGLYHLTDTGTGREQVARVKDGLYTWSYVDGEEAGFTPWPTLIQPDGSFGFDMEMTTVLKMGDAETNFSTGVVSQGKIDPAVGISLEFASHTAGATDMGRESPEIYTGAMIREAAIPNERLPKDIGTELPAAVGAVKSAPPRDLSAYPPWYINQPAKKNALFGVGQKTFPNRETAFAMAEAAAAASIALQIRVRIENTMEEFTNESTSRLESVTNIESMEKIPYRIAERVYQEDTGTAFVLLEMDF
jgi:hypothetical protein